MQALAHAEGPESVGRAPTNPERLQKPLGNYLNDFLFKVFMSRKCQIPGCNRTLKTGRKYCWEHRYTAQADSIRGEKLIEEATRDYRDSK